MNRLEPLIWSIAMVGGVESSCRLTIKYPVSIEVILLRLKAPLL